MIDWSKLPGAKKKKQLYDELRKILTPEKYQTGEWSLTELAISSDARSRIALQILDGLDLNGKRSPGIMAPNIFFRFNVLSRQACCKDKAGRKIWFKSASLENSDTDNDIVAKQDELPKRGDIVEWKGNKKDYDEFGGEIDAKVMSRWTFQGIRPEEYYEYEVDKDGCIFVPYPWAYSMLLKYGKRISKPKFRKKTNRQIVNWFFEEVPVSFSKKGSKDDVAADGPALAGD